MTGRDDILLLLIIGLILTFLVSAPLGALVILIAVLFLIWPRIRGR